MNIHLHAIKQKKKLRVRVWAGCDSKCAVRRTVSPGNTFKRPILMFSVTINFICQVYKIQLHFCKKKKKEFTTFPSLRQSPSSKLLSLWLIRGKPPAGILPFLWAPSRTVQMMINHWISGRIDNSIMTKRKQRQGLSSGCMWSCPSGWKGRRRWMTL